MADEAKQSSDEKSASLTTTRVLTSVGVISDIQYADIDDGQSYDKTENRYYRNALVCPLTFLSTAVPGQQQQLRCNAGTAWQSGWLLGLIISMVMSSYCIGSSSCCGWLV
jgi:hypothetical protein